MIYTKFSHKKKYEVSRLLIGGYNFIGYCLMIMERILIIPFVTIVLRIFINNSDELNFAEEVVTSVFESSWTVEHIIFCVFAFISFLCYIGLMSLSMLMLSLNFRNSPLPWSDESIIVRAINIILQILLPMFLVFDINVYSH